MEPEGIPAIPTADDTDVWLFDGRKALVPFALLVFILTAIPCNLTLRLISSVWRPKDRKCIADGSLHPAECKRVLKATCVRLFTYVDLACACFNASALLVIAWSALTPVECPDCEEDSAPEFADYACLHLNLGLALHCLALLTLAAAQAYVRHLLSITGVNASGEKILDETCLVNRVVLWTVGCLLFVLGVSFVGSHEPGLSRYLFGGREARACFPLNSLCPSPYLGILFTAVCLTMLPCWFYTGDAWRAYAEILLRVPFAHVTRREDDELLNLDESTDTCPGQRPVVQDTLLAEVPDQPSTYKRVDTLKHALFYFRCVGYPLLSVGFLPWFVMIFLFGSNAMMLSLNFYVVQVIYTLGCAFVPGVWGVKALFREGTPELNRL